MDPKTLLWIAVLVAWNPDGTPVEGSGVYPFVAKVNCDKKRSEYAARTALTIGECKRIRLDHYKIIMKSGIVFEDLE